MAAAQPRPRAWYCFSEQEEEALRQFRASLGADELRVAGDDDMTLMRFIRARKLDIPAALKMYRTAMKWRRENNVDSILQNCPHNWPLLRKIVAQAFVGYDHEGRPLLFQKTGLMHTEELCKFSVESILECRIYAQEQALQEMRVASERFNKNISTMVVIMDVDGINLSHRKTLKFMKYSSYMDQNYYPEILGRMVMINAPAVASTFWNIIKRWLDPVTQSKIFIFPRGSEELTSLVPPQYLPVEYGGEMKENVLPIYSAEEVQRAMADYREVRRDLEQLVVGARSKHRVRVEVPHPNGAEVSVFFQLESRDIGFSASFEAHEEVRRDAEGHLVLYQYTRHGETHMAPFHERFVIDRRGTLHIEFDNSYSILTSKTVRYFVALSENLDALPQEPAQHPPPADPAPRA